MQNIRADLLTAEKRADDFVYIYMTSHGSDPITMWTDKDLNDAQLSAFKSAIATAPYLDQYLFMVESTPYGTADLAMVIGAAKHGVKPEDLLMTPRHLRDILATWPKSTHKIVVVQACYSGGFVDVPQKPYADHTLKSLSNVTVLTAARYDRSSFGCDPGSDVTYYGGFFNTVLKFKKGGPDEIDWKAVHEEVKGKVDFIESSLRFKPSLPQFYQSPRRGSK
jgi:hypothetical protein